MATIKDIASEAQVAVGTVSRYLNGYNIKKQNQIKIRKAIEKFNYRINPIAQSLKTSRTKNIAILTNNISTTSMLTVLEIIQDILYKKGYRCFIYNNNTYIKENKINTALFSKNIIDAYIILNSSLKNRQLIKSATHYKIPTVIIETSNTYKGIDCINTDHYKAIYQAASILLNSGHKKISLITGYYDLSSSRQQILAIKDCYLNNKISTNNLSINLMRPSMDIDAKFNELVDNSTALICGNSFLTKKFVKFINKNNIHIPQSISFIGYDSDNFCELLCDKFTVIEKPLKDLGKLAAYTVLKRINGDYGNFPTKINLPASIKIGNSINSL